ncbi:TIGR00159 family protein [bacterium]|nr:TIGR00159 family protein [bacterium]PJA74899.1 MAG: TIGR00159 family protein [bacterium CG_4_9_14_3_um_filter_65_15]
MWNKIIQSPLIDLLDIIIVAYLLYRLIVFIKDTRVIQMFAGLAFLLILSFLATNLRMIVVGSIIGTLKTVWVVAFIIIFQPELRSALTNLGLRRGLGMFRAVDRIPAEEEILQAAKRLSKRGLGALIVIEREVKLSDWIQKGVLLDAEITAATLETVFTPPGPLHDGAVIISQGRIAAAAVVLPITEQEELGYVLGTRHRAAIGISEQSDCVVIVVSEETRAISVVHDGRIKRGLSQEDLAMELGRIYRSGERGPRRSRPVKPGPAPAPGPASPHAGKAAPGPDRSADPDYQA